MKLSEVLDSLMEGKPISRSGWENNDYMYYDKDDIIEVSLSDDGKTVWIHFDSGTIGFASELLWDKNVRETFKKNFEVD